ncbi:MULTISPECIES: glycoside hydrolase family 3 protein [unclassified Rhizobium]|uniref:glycoside hydrolase family 3 protein n=1 Tax=unclassified Rhizobium TaxID=2613769 RepID=UPI0015CEFEDD|nr:MULTISPECIES: glycoside hydrolase family 3 protein [unclassified Rhizobium]MDF0661689.1 glycoside hydrolase family 3 protein [Rhizobium sp. BC49]
MSETIQRDARAVFLPAFDTLDFHDIMVPFIDAGGCSVLIGESRSEYVARRMSGDRLARENKQAVTAAIDGLRRGQAGLIVAVDQELGGIRRLEGLAPPLPTLHEATRLPADEIEGSCYETARAAKELGVTMFLAPIADVVVGQNPWLEGRTLGTDRREVGRIVSAFIRGIQRAGITAVTKHFPGFIDLAGDPALVDVSMVSGLDEILENATPFREAIRAGTMAVMAGPAPVAALDPENAACTSAKVIELLRGEFGFTGLVISDDLDAPATMRAQSLVDTAVTALNAGVDLLLVAGGPHLPELCDSIVDAVQTGRLPADRLIEAANRVRHTASSSSQ